VNFNILGIGLPQIAIVLVLSLVLFGPKQMMQYAYQAGRFLSKARAMWEEAARNMQSEIQASGIDLKEFKDIGQGLRQDMNQVVGDVNGTIATNLNSVTTNNGSSVASVDHRVDGHLVVPAWQPGVPPVPTEHAEPSIQLSIPVSSVDSAPPPAPSLNAPELDSAASDDAAKKYDAWLLN